MREPEHQHAVVPETLAGKRLDQALAEMFPDHSRSRLKSWILAGLVRVDGLTPKPRDLVAGGERVELTAIAEPEVLAAPEPIPLDIVHEDAALIIVNKPAGLVVHPGAGNRVGTLQNALLYHDPTLVAVARAGIVHRLDKLTTGLMVIARTPEAHTALVRSLGERSISRAYDAVCVGVLTGGGTVDAPIGRHPTRRVQMAVRQSGKPAVSHYRVVDRFRGHSLVRVRLDTGRTHQIRVHMAHIRHPLVGDPVYGGRLMLPKGATTGLVGALRGFRRQALHAAQLALPHPTSGERLTFEAPHPSDLAALLETLAEDARAGTAG